MEKDQSFCLKWNNYQANMTAFLPQLREDEAFVDVTLACEGSQQLKAHKVSAGSMLSSGGGLFSVRLLCCERSQRDGPDVS